MTPFVFSGKKKIPLHLRGYQKVRFLYHRKTLSRRSDASLKPSLTTFFKKNKAFFSNKKVCVVIPDQTRNFHPQKILQPLFTRLQEMSCHADAMIALGMHRRLTRQELKDFLGQPFVREHKVFQHAVEDARSMGTINEVPASLNRKLFSYDTILTLGVVEPHLYAGYSGGVKGIGIGLAGLKTILHTHSVKYLSSKGVRVSNVRTNPFQQYLWEVCRRLRVPVYSLNLVNNLNKEIAGYSLGKARKSFAETVALARNTFSYHVRERFDLLMVGCDSPKDGNLYQASRLFNYVLDVRPLVRKGGIVCVFANLDNGKKSRAERNFEQRLKKSGSAASSRFTKPGEHRAFKVISASKQAELCIVTPHIPKGRFTGITFFHSHSQVLRRAQDRYGRDLNIGIVPAGFSFIP